MYSIIKRLPKLAGLAVIAVAAACSSERVASPVGATTDVAMNVAAPVMPSAVMSQATVAAQVEAPAPGNSRFHTGASILPSTAVTYQFVVDPTQLQSFIVGMHMVSFPAYTICDPSASGYGSSYWLQSCPKLTAPIVITATTWIDPLGRAQIDFANSIRFYPNSAGSLPAIYLRDPSAAMSAFGRIDYCSANGCVNEAASDTTLDTQRDPITGYLFRLIRHFSGYNVWA
jgi:hypothetical protein